MAERYWSFMLENKQLYRLMNGMDGVPIDREKVTTIAEHNFETATAIVQAWLSSSCGDPSEAELLFNDLWAVLHGMAALYLDRSAPFDLARAQNCVGRLLTGTKNRRGAADRGPCVLVEAMLRLCSAAAPRRVSIRPTPTH
jgi:hypothetical protein